MDDQNLILFLDTLKKTIDLGNLPVAKSLIEELEYKLETKKEKKIMPLQEQVDVLRKDIESIKDFVKYLKSKKIGNLCEHD